MSSSESEDWECPLCMEEMDIDDRGFFPCECGYQTPKLKPISAAQVAKIKNDKKAKEREKREIEGHNRRHLANVRVVQKNLVYVIGLPINLATESTLRGYDYFGQFGRINKIVINKRQAGTNSHHPTVGVYVTYATKDEATRAINAVDGSALEGRVLRATYGTTKYCSYYLRNIPCQNPGCMYLHEPGEEADSFTKEDLAANRAGLRDNHSEADEQDHSAPANRMVTRSPSTHLGSGRVVVVSANSFPEFQNNRPQTTAPALSQAPQSAARLRKSADLNGARPRSVEPHSVDSDHTTGSALPATASWASKAVAKKPAAASTDSKPRKSESGTMTLRMVPSSRSRTSTTSTATVAKPSTAAAAVAASSAAVAAPSPSAASASARDRSKTGASASSTAATSGSSQPNTGPQSQHHPVLQQLTRERKQQLRSQQARVQQKAAETAASAATNAETEETRPSKPKQNDSGSATATDAQLSAASKSSTESTPLKKKAKSKDAEDKQPNAQTANVPEAESEAAAEEAAPESEAAGQQAASASNGSVAEATQRLEAEPEKLEAAAVSVSGAIPAPIITKQEPLAVSDITINHTNSAQSFQSIADSMVAQLNAKVSTPTTGSVHAFPPASGFDGTVGGRISGFPVSNADPLLFPPSASGQSSSLYSRANSGLGASSLAFDPFAGPSASPWGTANAAGSIARGRSPLSALFSDTASLSPSLGGGNRDLPASTGLPSYSSRQRSRWDFAYADEASAQAELQSVLGRGPGSLGGLQQQQQQQQPPHAPNMPPFISSRDLGLFSTPVSSGNQNSLPSWGRHQSDSLVSQHQQHQHQQRESGPSTPFPPPGFGATRLGDAGKGEVDGLDRLTSSTPSAGMVGSNNTPSIGAGQNMLLSRLIGQTGGSDLGAPSGLSMPLAPPPGMSSDGSASTPAMLGYPLQHQQQQPFQDPAILSSYMNAAAGSAPSVGQQQQQNRADPLVLNSLLARLQLGRTTDSNSNAAGAGSLFGHAQPSTGSIMPPGLMPMGNTSAPAPAPGLSPLYASHLGAAGMAGSVAPQMPHTTGGGSFVDPAIMQVGRLNATPVGPPPGIANPLSDDVHNQQQQQQQQSLMLSRSANSSGRSRFLNHFSAGDGADSQQSIASHGPPAGANDEDEDKGRPMVNGVPPGLPTTGLFGELLRRAKQDAASASTAAAAGTPMAAVAGDGSADYISGRVMLGGIERRIDAAKSEARELQAQLSSVIGQNQQVFWALANGGQAGTAANAAGNAGGGAKGGNSSFVSFSGI
ncbi:transcriptional repressor general negative regulator of transcription subunit 4 [Dipsacomyces acuminosporus]|nr:transcriptional repressor general negative regulator of transcription subunit 4 [Dipsacomyces acuminosporus]